jgi:phosphoribosylanthranilate isomerase
VTGAGGAAAGVGLDGTGAGRVRVKICGIARPEDAAACEAAGADAIGLIFAPGSRRRVDAARAREVADAAGPFLTRVGVFQDAGEEEILAAVEAARLDAVQLHGDEPDGVAARLRHHVRVVRALRFAPGLTPADLAGRPHDGVLLDGLRPGSGEAFDWEAARAWRGHPRLILAGGLRPETVADAVRALRPYAVDVASGVEAAPGAKDAEAVAAFVRAARGA